MTSGNPYTILAHLQWSECSPKEVLILPFIHSLFKWRSLLSMQCFLYKFVEYLPIGTMPQQVVSWGSDLRRYFGAKFLYRKSSRLFWRFGLAYSGPQITLVSHFIVFQKNKIILKASVCAFLTPQTHFNLLEDTNFNLELLSQYSFITSPL